MLEVMLALCLQEDGRFFRRKEVDFWNRPKPQPVWTEQTIAQQLLDEPTPENAERYLAWQRERLERIRRAAEMLSKVQREPGLYYFSRPDCRYCVEQERVLATLPAKFVRVEPGSPLWSRYNVRVTPTLVVGTRVFEGFTPRAVLEKELSHVDR